MDEGLAQAEYVRLEDDYWERQVWAALDVDGRDYYQVRSPETGEPLFQVWFDAGVDRGRAYNAINGLIVG